MNNPSPISKTHPQIRRETWGIQDNLLKGYFPSSLNQTDALSGKMGAICNGNTSTKKKAGESLLKNEGRFLFPKEYRESY